MDQALVPIYTAANLVEAQMLRDWLAERGISAWIINEALAGGVGGLPAGWASSPRVVVAGDDAAKGRELALAFDEAMTVSLQRSSEGMHEAAPYDPGFVDPWPYCPVCSERRMAVCSFCGTASTDFPQGFDGAAPRAGALDDADPSPMVICSMCDEPFRPHFFKYCEHCGYEFEDGVAIEKPVTAEEMTRSRVREWIVMGLLAALLLGGVYYLWYVFGW